MIDVIVIGAGPAGVVAALRAADLGARTALVTRDEFGGMAANDGPVPVRTLAHAARLIREARQLGQYGIAVSEPVLDYPRLLARVREVAHDVRACSTWREQIDSLGVSVYEHAGVARFVDPQTIETATGLRLQAEKFILCTGGISRRLDVPGFEFTNTHSDAWSLTSVPPSMLVIGGGATGAQVASVFNAFGSRVQLFHRGPRILPTEDDDISAAVASAFRGAGIVVQENFGEIESFEKTPSGVRMNYCHDGDRNRAEASLAVVAVGWQANTAGLNLAAAGVETDARGFVRVDPNLQNVRAAHFCGWRCHRSPAAGPASDSGRLRGGDQRGSRRDDDAGRSGEPDRQLHGPGIRPGGTHRIAGPSGTRCRGLDDPLRRDHAHDYRRAHVRLLQTDRRSRDAQDSRLPRRRRTGGRDHAGRGDRHHRRNASR